MIVIFSHGREGSPSGTKSKILEKIARELHYEFLAPDYTSIENPDDRANKLIEIVNSMESPIILAGSSMGGYISTVVSNTIKCAGLFLIAPALYMPNYKVQLYPTNANTVYVRHGWQDEIIPVENSIKFAKSINCELKVVNDNHRMSKTLLDLQNSFRNFLISISNENN